MAARRICLMLAVTTLALAQNCYYPNGDLSTTDVACSASGGICCPYQWECLSNGLCFLPNENFFGRYTCTDWEFGDCPDLCTQNRTAAGNEAISQCTDGSWCCDGNRSTDCCADRNAVSVNLPPGSTIATITSTPSAPTTPPRTSSTRTTTTTDSTPTSPTSSTSSGSSSFTSTLTSTNANGQTTITTVVTATAGPSPSPAASSLPSIGMIAGLAAGLPAALVALGLVGFLVFSHRRKAQKAQLSQSDMDPDKSTAYGHFTPDGRAPELDSFPVAPVRSKSGRASELPHSPAISSLRSSVISSGDGRTSTQTSPYMVSSPHMPTLRAVNEEPAELWAGYVPYRPPQRHSGLASVDDWQQLGGAHEQRTTADSKTTGTNTTTGLEGQQVRG